MQIEWAGGSVAAALKRTTATMGMAVTAGVAAATEGAKTALRRQLTGSGYHFARAANAIRGDAYPKGGRYSFNAAGNIYAAGPAAERMMAAFANGVTITPNGKRALAIPLHDARGFGSQRSLLGPGSSYFGKKLVFIPFRGHAGRAIGLLCSPADQFFHTRLRRSAGRARFASRTPSQLIPQFLLVRAVTLPRLLSPEAVLNQWAGRLPDLVQQAAEILDR